MHRAWRTSALFRKSTMRAASPSTSRRSRASSRSTPPPANILPSRTRPPKINSIPNRKNDVRSNYFGFMIARIHLLSSKRRCCRSRRMIGQTRQKTDAEMTEIAAKLC